MTDIDVLDAQGNSLWQGLETAMGVVTDHSDSGDENLQVDRRRLLRRLRRGGHDPLHPGVGALREAGGVSVLAKRPGFPSRENRRRACE